jgi:hypothetical protein
MHLVARKGKDLKLVPERFYQRVHLLIVARRRASVASHVHDQAHFPGEFGKFNGLPRQRLASEAVDGLCRALQHVYAQQ